MHEEIHEQSGLWASLTYLSPALVVHHAKVKAKV